MGLATGFECHFVEFDPPIGAPNLKIRGVVSEAAISGGKGEGLGLRAVVRDRRVTLQEQEEFALLLGFELDETTALVGGNAAAVGADADDAPHIAGWWFAFEGHWNVSFLAAWN